MITGAVYEMKLQCTHMDNVYNAEAPEREKQKPTPFTTVPRSSRVITLDFKS